MSPLSLRDGSNWNSPWQLNKDSRTRLYCSLEESLRTVILTELTAVHLITGVFAVHFLVTLAGVRDAASVAALELIGRAQRRCHTQSRGPHSYTI